MAECGVSRPEIQLPGVENAATGSAAEMPSTEVDADNKCVVPKKGDIGSNVSVGPGSNPTSGLADSLARHSAQTPSGR